MGGSTRQEHPPLESYDLSGIGTLVDVGGGDGSTLIALLAANPRLHGVLFDRPHVVAGADARLAAAGLADRCRVAGGDFFAGVPAGGDAYLLRHVLHNWDDRRAAMILERCRRAIEPDGRLLIEDRVIESRTGADDPSLLDLHMLVAHGGRERTGEEFLDLLKGAGFALRTVMPIGGSLVVLEAEPVSPTDGASGEGSTQA